MAGNRVRPELSKRVAADRVSHFLRAASLSGRVGHADSPWATVVLSNATNLVKQPATDTERQYSRTIDTHPPAQSHIELLACLLARETRLRYRRHVETMVLERARLLTEIFFFFFAVGGAKAVHVFAGVTCCVSLCVSSGRSPVRSTRSPTHSTSESYNIR